MVSPASPASSPQDPAAFPVPLPAAAHTLRVYHGTGYKFDRFVDVPMFFTTDLAAAAAYALNCAVPEECEYEMVVLGVDVDPATLEVLDANAFAEKFGADGRHSSESWEAAGNYAFDLFTQTGRAGILIRGCRDYGGKDARTQEVFDRHYDQVILAAPGRYPIVERILIPAGSTIQKPGPRPKLG